jgi:cysteinyl-tRNA synthetase
MLNPLKIYDSLSNQYLKIVGDTISIYNCGPTVYNDIHIGNARPLITFDVLNRLLNVRKCRVTYIHNITDIDDKIIAKAKELKKTEKEIATIYGEHYLEINKALNIQPIEMMPKVSDHVYDIINYIQRLIDKKAAYAVDGDVYFDISSVSNYGVLSHQNIDALYEGVRKENNANKKSPLDFVL